MLEEREAGANWIFGLRRSVTANGVKERANAIVSPGRSGNSGNGKFWYLKMLTEIDPKKVIPEISDSGSGFSRNTRSIASPISQQVKKRIKYKSKINISSLMHTSNKQGINK